MNKRELIEKLSEQEYLIECINIQEARNSVWKAANYIYPKVFRDRGAAKEIADAYQLILDREILTLRISAPPRFTKTFLKNIFSLAYFYRNPLNSIMAITGSEELAVESSKFVRNAIQNNPEVQKLFDNLAVNPKDSSNSTWKLVGSERPSYATGGILSGNVGKGANLLVTDDIFKNFGEVASDSVRKKILQERLTTLDDRTESDFDGNLPQIIDLGTSWGVGDHFDVLSKEDFYDAEVKIAAFEDKGGKMISICPTWRSTEWLNNKKAMLDMYEWECSYMQNPITPEGLMYNQGFKTYQEVPKEIAENSKIRSIVDPANQGEDWLVAIAYYEYINGKDRFAYVKDIMYTQADMTETLTSLPNFLIRNDVTECVIEVNKESMFVKWMEDKMKEAGHFTTAFKEYYQRMNKLERIREYSMVVQNNIFFPQNWKGRWVMFSDGVIKFPRVPGRKQKDDHVDCLTKVAEETVGSLKKVILV